MHLRLVAVGDRQPAWVDAASGDYAGRLLRAWKFSVRALPLSRRRRGADAALARDDECAAILRELKDNERAIMLDERGTELSTAGLAEKLAAWQSDGRDLCFVIGGPDGLNDACRERADFSWSLSRLTLPHGLARVLCIEQLYRAASLNDGHPYHRA